MLIILFQKDGSLGSYGENILEIFILFEFKVCCCPKIQKQTCLFFFLVQTDERIKNAIQKKKKRQLQREPGQRNQN